MNNGLLESRDEYLLSNFERALTGGRIAIYSQAVVRASNGKVCEEELLVRWEDPVLGVLNPNDFVPVLERNGLVERLDLYIVEKALENIKKQADVGVNIATTSINISLLDFQNQNFVKEIESRVCASNIPKSKIAFELSESTALIDNHETATQLLKLKKFTMHNMM
ncbi:EAL domain-containing protein [Lachnospiraceae bacterium XBB1006]|nr:EAL domain-containing protein [Lachnospiraceae bacterium XBB1006]